MNAVRLTLPIELMADLDLSDPNPDGTADPDMGADRGAGDVLDVAINTLNVTASVITLATLEQQLPALAQAIRHWVFRQPRDEEVVLTVRGPGLALEVHLPPNVSTRSILDALGPLVLAPTAAAPRPEKSRRP